VTVSLTWDQVLAWRMSRQHVVAADGGSAVEIARRLCGVQAQLASAAENAVLVRQHRPRPGEIGDAPARGTRVTFTRPDLVAPSWSGQADVDEAARAAVPAYLSAYGPAGPDTFDRWLLRGATPRGRLRRWFADLGDELTGVEVEGVRLTARARDVDDLASSRPSRQVRLLPAFDQYVLGPGTAHEQVVPTQFRARVSRSAGWISAVVVAGGRVVGTWEQDGGQVRVSLFEPGRGPGRGVLEREVARMSGALGRELTLASVT
jgi:hypothetical protein